MLSSGGKFGRDLERPPGPKSDAFKAVCQNPVERKIINRPMLMEVTGDKLFFTLVSPQIGY